MQAALKSGRSGGSRLRDYHINIFDSDEDGGYIADIPDLAHCSAFGESPEEALRELQIAKSLWFSVATEAGKPVPTPSYRSVMYQVATG